MHSFLSLLEKTGSNLSGPESLDTAGLRDAFVELGDRYLEALDHLKPGAPEEAEALFLHFHWAERMKQLLLLYRDVLFQHLKGKVLLADGKLGEEALRNHWERSVETLRAAGAELARWVEEKSGELSQGGTVVRKQLEQWRLQNNPWPVYREQLNAISAQGDFLRKNHGEALAALEVFQKIRRLAADMIKRCTSDIQTLETLAGETQSWLETTQDSAQKIASRLEHTEATLSLQNHLEDLIRDMEKEAALLPEKWQAALGVEGGLVLRSDLDLLRRVMQWLEGEALPLLYEIWELAEAGFNEARMAFSNIRNRVLIVDTKEPFQAAGLVQPLVRNRIFLRDSLGKSADLIVLIDERMETQFRLSNIYDTAHPFLPVSMQSAVRQLGARPTRTFDRIQAWFSARLAFLQGLLRRVEQEEQLSFSEKVARYIETRQPDTTNPHYVPIFMTRGFVGASFAVGRRAEMEHLENLVRQWEAGFRGAAILSGDRFSGKTFLGEWAASRFFPGKIIRLSPGAEIVLKGRKSPATYNLGEALDFLKKHGLNDRPLLWIDDLELWQDTTHTLFDNARALLRFNDQSANRCFVLVSMNRWVHRQLQAQLDIDRGFQATINLGEMTREEIARAILIRHGATHKKLVQKEGSELTPGQYSTLVKQIWRMAAGNIGEALQWWAASVICLEEDQVICNLPEEYTFPEMPDTDTALLLEEILLQKRTDEYHLRKQFGPAFQERYVDVVRRLLAMGLLSRLPDGDLEVRDCVANAVAGRILIYD